MPAISVTRPGPGKTHDKSNGKWSKFMANGKSEPVANGKAGIPLSTVKATMPILESDESVEQETDISDRPITTQINVDSVDQRQIIETLLEIKHDIKKEVSTLNSKMSRLDSQIEVIIRTMGSTNPLRSDSSPNSSSIRVESEPNDARSTSPDSNSSLKAPKRLSKKIAKGSKVSPTPNISSESPTRSKANSRRDSALSTAGESGASRYTLTTLLDTTDEDLPTPKSNSERKHKISNLDML